MKKVAKAQRDRGTEEFALKNFVPLKKPLWLIIMGLTLFIAPASFAEGVMIATHSAGKYVSGNQLTVANTMEYTGAVTALGFKVTLPEGWSFVAVSGDDLPPVKPAPGATGSLDFAWLTPPPICFSYTLLVPPGERGQKQVGAVALYRIGLGEELQANVMPDPLLMDADTTGDVNGDGITDLADLISVLKLLSGQAVNNINNDADLNGDGRIGLEEALFILQRISGNR